jgi:RNA recognition motif-containing protein
MQGRFASPGVFTVGKKLYVGNLTYSVAAHDLEQLFSQFGTVQSAQVIQDRETGRSKGFGFVEMDTESQAQAAIDGLHDQEHDGRRLTVNEAKPREALVVAVSKERGRIRSRSPRTDSLEKPACDEPGDRTKTDFDRRHRDGRCGTSLCGGLGLQGSGLPSLLCRLRRQTRAVHEEVKKARGASEQRLFGGGVRGPRFELRRPGFALPTPARISSRSKAPRSSRRHRLS